MRPRPGIEDGVGLLGTAIGFLVVYGIGGLVLAGVAGVTWWLTATGYAIAVAALLAGMVGIEATNAPGLVGLLVAFVSIPVMDLWRDRPDPVVVGSFVVGVLVLSLATLAAVDRYGAVLSVVFVGLLVATISYGLHRFERVSLHLVEGSHDE